MREESKWEKFKENAEDWLDDRRVIKYLAEKVDWEKVDEKVPYFLQSGYRFPFNFTRVYLKPSTYKNALVWSYERVKDGLSYRDLWNFDNYCSGIIIKALEYHRDYAMGYPAHMTVEEWRDELEWAIGFFEKQRDHDLFFEGYVEAEDKQAFMEAHEEENDEGWVRFGRMFQSLWD